MIFAEKNAVPQVPVVESFAGQWITNKPDQQRVLSNEEALFKQLFSNYNKNIRANYNSTDALKVELGLAIRRIEYLVSVREMYHIGCRIP